MADQSARSPYRGLVASGLTDVGRKRDHNEDAFLVRSDLGLFAVADGAGGHNAGEIASNLIVASLQNFFEATEPDEQQVPELDKFGLPNALRRLSLAVGKANSDVREIARQYQKSSGMGSTLVVAYVRTDWRRLYLANIGDSRCYRLRGGYLEQLSHDHSMINDVLEMRPDVPDAVLEKIPHNVVTRAIGMGDRLRADLRVFELAPGDRYLLCSDGLSRYIEGSRLHAALSSPEAPADVLRQLIDLANESGGADNITGVIIDYERPEHVEAKASSGSVRPGEDPSFAVKEEASGPELLLLGIESDAEIKVTGETASVPDVELATDASKAVDEFLKPLKEGAAPEIVERTKQLRDGERLCSECGTVVPADAIYCPMCGTKNPMKE